MSNSLFRVYRAVALTLSATALVVGSAACAAPSDDTLSGDDQTFIQLREAARRNDAAKAAQLAATIPN